MDKTGQSGNVASREQWLLEMHEGYTHGKRRRKRRVFAVRTILLVLFFFIWEAGARSGWIDELLFSYPTTTSQRSAHGEATPLGA